MCHNKRWGSATSKRLESLNYSGGVNIHVTMEMEVGVACVVLIYDSLFKNELETVSCM